MTETNHEEARDLANLKKDESNLARCYLDLRELCGDVGLYLRDVMDMQELMGDEESERLFRLLNDFMKEKEDELDREQET